MENIRLPQYHNQLLDYPITQLPDAKIPAMPFLPIGDTYTMGPLQAAKACELLAVKHVVPMHYGTFPTLTGTPQRLRELVEPRGVQVLELRPGETTTESEPPWL